MSINPIIQGGLFSQDYLETAVRDDPDYFRDSPDDLFVELRGIFDNFLKISNPNEADTESNLIWPVLGAIGWTAYLPQQRLKAGGRSAVPDGLLFLDEAMKRQAGQLPEEWKRYSLGAVLVESKRWMRPLDMQSERHGERIAPSTQMLRYLRLVDDHTDGELRWGILTNGCHWRLYWQGARSVSEQYFQFNLADLLGYPCNEARNGDIALSEEERSHWLRIFALVFGRASFLPSSSDSITFIRRTLDSSQYFEERVAENLSHTVFENVFPSIVKGLADAVPGSSPTDVRDAALIFLYRLLFIFYAEDRNLLPMWDSRYDSNSIRKLVRDEIGARVDRNYEFSSSLTRYWNTIDDLAFAISRGDSSMGLSPYNGKLFDRNKAPVLADARLTDSVIAPVIDCLSFDRSSDRRRYINYQELSVQQLGSIYERLLEQNVVRNSSGSISIRPSAYARKATGSYYTPDDLVQLIIRETLQPLIRDKYDAFQQQLSVISDKTKRDEVKIALLKGVDPAAAILELKICDPAMGSGHFLVNLVDYLAHAVHEAIADANAMVNLPDDIQYVSPLLDTVNKIRWTIMKSATDASLTLDDDRLTDRNIIRRIILKRCVYGVDKNEMAVELAKVSLWLHTFTAGAPLSFLDHHLHCGNSLFGEWVANALDKLDKQGKKMLMIPYLRQAIKSAGTSQKLDFIADADIAEVDQSTEFYDDLVELTDPLNSILRILQTLEWMNLKDEADCTAVHGWLDGLFGDPIRIAQEVFEPALPTYHRKQVRPSDRNAEDFSPVPENGSREREQVVSVLQRARNLLNEEKFYNWEVSYPGVWKDWEGNRTGGFDAVVSNPPWERIKMQPVEWFAARDSRVSTAPTDAIRRKVIRDLERTDPDLYIEYNTAAQRAKATAVRARQCGDYPLLSSGDINLYALFVERCCSLLKPGGMLGLLIPTGIATSKTASRFFRKVSGEGRLKAIYDFENKGLFPDVHSSFKFCAFIASSSRMFEETQCAFNLHNVHQIDDADRTFSMSVADFHTLNPNTGTMPMLRSHRDARLMKLTYAKLPILANHRKAKPRPVWPVTYYPMLHLAGDSDKFRNQGQLTDDEGAWKKDESLWEDADGLWHPLHVGRMIGPYDHRAASVSVDDPSLQNPALSNSIPVEDKANPKFTPTPQFWVRETEVPLDKSVGWMLGFRDIARSTDIRTMIAAAIPWGPVGHTLPLLLPSSPELERSNLSLLLGNLNSVMFDYLIRQKEQSAHLSWYIVEQMPVVPPDVYETTSFGPKSAGQVVKEAVLELTYTSHSMAPFAKDLGYVDARGRVRQPFKWNVDRRLRLKAKLDAVYFLLYGMYNKRKRKDSREDIEYIYSTFPILERQETRDFGSFLTRDLALAYCNSLSAGKPDADPQV